MTVIEGNFRKPEPLIRISCVTLYADDFVALTRITYWLGGRTFIQHITTELPPT